MRLPAQAPMTDLIRLRFSSLSLPADTSRVVVAVASDMFLSLISFICSVRPIVTGLLYRLLSCGSLEHPEQTSAVDRSKSRDVSYNFGADRRKHPAQQIDICGFAGTSATQYLHEHLPKGTCNLVLRCVSST